MFRFFFCVGSFPAADALGDTEFAFLYKVFSVALATTYAVLTTIFFPLSRRDARFPNSSWKRSSFRVHLFGCIGRTILT